MDSARLELLTKGFLTANKCSAFLNEVYPVLTATTPTILKWIAQGKLKGIRVGHQHRITLESINDFVRTAGVEVVDITGGGTLLPPKPVKQVKPDVPRRALLNMIESGELAQVESRPKPKAEPKVTPKIEPKPKPKPEPKPAPAPALQPKNPLPIWLQKDPPPPPMNRRDPEPEPGYTPDPSTLTDESFDD